MTEGREVKTMQVEAEEARLFDIKLYRALLKKRRLQLGYKDARVFARIVCLLTKVEINPSSYYKIESGKQGIKAEQFMALNLALWGTPWPEQVMALCVGPDWASSWLEDD